MSPSSMLSVGAESRQISPIQHLVGFTSIAECQWSSRYWRPRVFSVSCKISQLGYCESVQGECLAEHISGDCVHVIRFGTHSLIVELFG